jgi:hypothetical protein
MTRHDGYVAQPAPPVAVWANPEEWLPINSEPIPELGFRLIPYEPGNLARTNLGFADGGPKNSTVTFKYVSYYIEMLEGLLTMVAASTNTKTTPTTPPTLWASASTLR